MTHSFVGGVSVDDDVMVHWMMMACGFASDGDDFMVYLSVIVSLAYIGWQLLVAQVAQGNFWYCGMRFRRGKSCDDGYAGDSILGGCKLQHVVPHGDRMIKMLDE